MAQSVIGALRVMLGADTAAFDKAMRNATKSLQSVGKKMQSVGKTMTTRMSLPIATAGGIIIKAAGDFEAGMNKVQAILQPTTQDFAKLRDVAKELGRTTQFSASQAADGIEMLARNGLTATQILDGAANATLRLAAAAGSELAPAADVVTDLMINFKKEGDDLNAVVDNIAGTLSKSKLGWDDYAEAVGQAAGVAGPLGMTLEDMNAGLALTAPSFASGSEAGTSFKGMMLRLVPEGKKAADMMEKFNLRFFDAAGNVKSLAGIAETLRTNLSNLTKEQQTDVLKTLFGQRTVRTAIRLMEEGAAGVNRIKQEMAGVSAEKMAEARLKGFNGAMVQLKSAAEGLAIAIADSGLLEAVTSFVMGLTDMVRNLAETNPQILKFGTIIAGVGVVLGPVIFSLGLLVSGVVALSGPIGLAVVAITGLTGAVLAFWPEIKNAAAAMTQWWEDTHWIPQALFEAVQTWLVGRLSTAWETVKGGIDSVQSKFRWLYDTVVGNSIIPDLVRDVGRWMGRMSSDMGSSFDGMRSAMRSFGLSASHAFAGVVTGSRKASDAVKGLVQQLAHMAAQRSFQTLLSALFPGPGTAPGALGGSGSAALYAGRFAHGVSFQVPGPGGVDSQLVTLRATPGEMVHVTKGEQAMGGTVTVPINVNLDARGADRDAIERAVLRLEAEIPSRAVQAVRDAQSRRAM